MRRLGVSNLAWPDCAQADALAMLAAAGAQGIEVAPTRLVPGDEPWQDMTDAHLAACRHACEQAGLSVSSLQAIFYRKPQAALLADAAAFAVMSEHVRRIAGIAAALGAGVAVFGAPNNRLRGALSPAEAMRLGAERLRALGEIAATGSLILGIEPVPPVYGADFLNHASDVIDIVRLVDHPNVRVHLDTACVTLAGDDPALAIRNAAPWLAHYHIAEPQLGPFTAPVCNHAAAGAALDAAEYAGWAVIEMREVEAADFGLGAVRDALGFALGCYG